MRVVVCGAGIAGLSLAWWLERAGWEVLVVERAPEQRGAGYLIDFFGPGYDAVERMGLLPRVRERAQRVAGVRYRDPTGRVTGTIPYSSFLRLQRGRVVTMMRGELENILFEALGPGVEFRYSTSVDAVTTTDDHVAVTLTTGEVERADLLVGADGVHSRVRGLAFGPERRFLRHLGYHTAAYLFTDPAIAARLDDHLEMLEAPGLQAGVCRLDGDRCAAVFAHRAPADSLPQDARARLRERYADLGWLLPEVLDHCPEPSRLYYDEVAQIETASWTRPRVVLLGDACQAVSLLAGQGAAMAVAGACVLAEELLRDGDAVAAPLRYEARVRPAIVRKQRAGRRTADWFVPATRARLRLRTAVLRLAAAPGLTGLLSPVLTTPADRLNSLRPPR
ncbi:FAD-dependent oxidoreductase [Thermobifida halotolerans]|uniref:FAD-dependent oxidoreductase n=1 Tax=Thermobifida halotolerans TaxID=483545 RepID=A0A399G5M4_9ACTN|nr:FAD-dependent oxidoreductase [Thermobifida halotolerans]UOE20093.1 FAD-dependent oxidoreductase [Thermobifida halotolerans]